MADVSAEGEDPSRDIRDDDALIGGGLYIFANLLDVRVPLPIEVSQGLRIERPPPEVLQGVQELVSGLTSSNHVQRADLRLLFEGIWIPGSRPGSFQLKSLPASEWRYLALTYTGLNESAHQFVEAAMLSDPALASLGFIMTSKPYGRGEYRGRGGYQIPIVHRMFPLGVLRRLDPEPLDQLAVERLRAAYSAYRALDRNAHPGTYRAFQLFSLFQRLPIANSLDVLAMFMIIEMLLTHNPGDKEIGDSLKHQISEKLPFVFARMGERVDYSRFDGTVSEKKVWSLLYDYRSSVAHGGAPDFKRKLAALRDQNTADQFLIRTTRRLLRNALDDPDLLAGLKNI